MTRQDPDQISESVRDQAIAWLMRVESDAATEGDWLALEHWLAASPEHRAAYDGLELMSGSFEAFADEIVPLLADDAGTEGVVDLAARRAPVRAAPSRRTMFAGAAAAIAAVLVGVVGVSLFSRPATTLYETGRGQPRTITLADGSTMSLNGGSRVRVRLERNARRVFMDDAEASFDVAHDASRPFLIDAGDRQVRVVGTEFNVRNTPDRLTVTVRRGIVQVGPRRSAGAARRLTAGQQLTHVPGTAQSQVRAVEAGEAFAWKSGRLVCRDRRLEDIVTDLNRQMTVPITVEGAARDLRFSGVLLTGDEDAVVRALRAYLPIRATREGDTIRLESR